MNKIKFKCHYCPAVFKDFKSLVEHFEKTHRDGEYIVIEVQKEFVEEVKQDGK